MDNTTDHKLVYGLGSGFVYACGGGGRWKVVLPKLLETFNNPVLISTVDMPFVAAETIYNTVGSDWLYVDSGGFTLFKDQMKYGPESNEFKNRCEKMKRKFLKLISLVHPVEVFELDNEYFRKDTNLLSPKNYCREDVHKILGYYPTPVFKMHQGFQYWKDLCDSDLYPKLAIGGLAQTNDWHTCTDEVKRMMEYARMKGKKVHLLGCQNAEAYNIVRPTTVDYSIFQYHLNLKRAREEHPELDDYDELKIHVALNALARARSRSILYESITNEE